MSLLLLRRTLTISSYNNEKKTETVSLKKIFYHKVKHLNEKTNDDYNFYRHGHMTGKTKENTRRTNVGRTLNINLKISSQSSFREESD